MERLMMKNSAGFKVDRLWYATRSRMQLPMRDSIPGRKKKILSWVRDCAPVGIHACTKTPKDQYSRNLLVVWTYKIRCRVNLWGCLAPWRRWRQTHQMCLKHFPSKMLTFAHTHKLITNNAMIEEFTQTWYSTDVVVGLAVKTLKRQQMYGWKSV